MDLLRQPSLPGTSLDDASADGASADGASPDGASPDGSNPAGQSGPDWRVPLPPWHPLACEAPDLPGNGHSAPAPDGDYTIRAQAATVAALIEQRGRGPVHLIGNSLGGAVCTRLAATRPQLIKTLTLISPALPDLRPRPVPTRISSLRVPGFGPWLIRRAARIPAEQRVAVTLRDVYFDASRVHPDRFAEEVAEVKRQDGLGYAGDVLLQSAKGLISEYLRRGPQTLWRDAARVQANTLVIHGSNDRLVDPRMAARAARTFPRVRTVILSRTGHVAMMERPAAVAAEMRVLFAARQPAGDASY
jgi:pimeloyl-ACP methyl ester carboxylesterase